MKKHKKHADIKRPSLGQFGRLEIGLIGAPCDIITNVVRSVTASLGGVYDITYIDADHQASEQPLYVNLTDKISHDNLAFQGSLNDFDRKILLSQSDILLVNGNHFKAKKQIVFCTQKKKESLERKLDRLTDVGLMILDNDISEPHDFLKAALPNYQEIPIINIAQVDQLSNWIKQFYQDQLPQIKGLVLAGGKSQRMGENKALLDYHGEPQVAYAARQFKALGIDPIISCRKEQADLYAGDYELIHDTFEGLGPNGAILSAFRSDPDAAWLVTACDQPLLKSEHLQQLINQRQSNKLATCFHNPETKFPEPLITLWEPKAYPRLLSFLSMGYSCPRKVLINSDVHEIHVSDTDFMKNANTPEEKEAIKASLTS